MAKKPSGKQAPPDASMRVVVLHGPEAFLRSELTAKLKELLTESTGGEVDSIRFDGVTATLADVLDECRSFGLMQQHKLVVVDEADQLLKGDGRAVMERYVASPAPDATLVLRSSRWHPGNLDKAIATVGTVYKCEIQSERDALAVAKRWATQRHGVPIDDDAAGALIERLGADLGRIDSELGKLAATARGDAPKESEARITAAHVRSLVGRTREEEVWAIQAELLSGQADRALALLGALFEQSPRGAAVPVSYAVVDLARSLSVASRALASGENPGAVGKKLRLWPPQKQQAVMGIASRMSPSEARSLLSSALDTDAGLKSGGGDHRRLLEIMAVRMTGAIRS